MKRTAALTAIVCTALTVATGHAGADTAEVAGLAGARAAVAEAELTPSPLFPRAGVPAFVRRRPTAELTLDGETFNVTITFRNYGYFQFSRSEHAALGETLRSARLQRLPTPRKRFGSRTVYSLCKIACGYGWHEQGYTYMVFARPGSGPEYQRAYRALPRIVRGLRPLPAPIGNVLPSQPASR